MSEPCIKLHKNGPIRVEGGVKLVDHQGNEFNLEGKDSYFLCRCGHTEKGPFCDGSHKKSEFQTNETAE